MNRTQQGQIDRERDKVETMRKAVDYFFFRLKQSEDFWFQCGWGNEIFRRMTNAYAAINGISEEEAENKFKCQSPGSSR